MKDHEIAFQEVKDIFPPIITIIAGSLAFLFFIVAIIYYAVKLDCDVVFWSMIIVSTILIFSVLIINTINNVVVMERFFKIFKRKCNLSSLSQDLLNEPLLNPWLGLVMSLIAALLLIGMIIYYLVTEKCDTWFWGLLILGYVLSLIVIYRDYVNTHFAVKISHREYHECFVKRKQYVP